jgi:hypothetical protein
VRVQAFRAEPAIERFDEHIIRGLAGPGEVESDAALVGPEVHVARHELTALNNADGLGIARLPTDPIPRRHDSITAAAATQFLHRNVASEGVHHSHNPQLLVGGQLVVNGVHRPSQSNSCQDQTGSKAPRDARAPSNTCAGSGSCSLSY